MIANDKAATNDLARASLTLCKPAGSKLIVKTVKDSIDALNNGKADKYDLFIVVGNVKDAYELASKVDRITEVNVGGLPARKDTHPFPGDNNINLSDEDEKLLNELIEMGKNVGLCMVPSEKVKKL